MDVELQSVEQVAPVQRRRRESSRSFRIIAVACSCLLICVLATLQNGNKADLSLRMESNLYERGTAMQLLESLLSNSTDNSTATANYTVSSTEDFGKSSDGCPLPPKFRTYYVNQLFWTWSHTLEVSGVKVDEDGKESVVPLGLVRSQPFSFASEQTWQDNDGKLVASSHQDAITTVTNIYVQDCAKEDIATISEQIAASSSAISQYTIQNKEGDIVAISTMSRNFGTEVDINDQSTGKRFVTISKGWGQLTDAWSATFRKGMPETLANEPRVIVMLLAAASSAGSMGYGNAGGTFGGTQYV
ncbi:hypothetical protein GUITHDRAFT_116486 [Guillardia theta CCMP2712]|uniref:Uncharacterized protein n=1 Tax=Guillardia theta (strain CCMP2712) TaxID=905079 RepID=L1IM72_GUITC|nr:hypothetical protein GUITHDRAFT_116486 [Guillardia theta CCMP2712]EKX37373.1 hypothetical protein GUITHDRAFT_116486 [Guillardia theta CCMP2712]|eukprot:XP_005824353.1 hypothetical protein GUITHDRAFT_116486 [Guillardia theta CCMP2712]